MYDQLNNRVSNYKDFDNDFFVRQKNEPKDKQWKSNINAVSIHTYIRNQIHYPK